MHTLNIIRPDDWHVHFRDNDVLVNTVSATAAHFSRALVMPNLLPALTSLKSVIDYRERITSALQGNTKFTPYMTLYLNEAIHPDEFASVKQSHYILGAKLYPKGATTNSSEGARSIKALYPLFDAMQTQNLVLQIHGEVTFGDIFERESLFIKTHLMQLIRDFPKLRIVLEHISTKVAVDFISDAPETIAATITPHHLLYNRNQLLAGGIKPHYYCLPILKGEQDQRALQQAAVSGKPQFFAGTDSAPHAIANKENACGCAGIYSAPYAVAMYATVFDKLNKLNKLEAFMSRFGAEFYQLSLSKETIELIKQNQVIPETLPFGRELVVPLAAGSILPWSVNEAP